MDLTETVVPAQGERQHWHGEGAFNLPEDDTLKIESVGFEHLNFDIPAGGCRVEITLTITRLQ